MTERANARGRLCACGRVVCIKLGSKDVQGRHTYLVPAHKIPSGEGWCKMRRLAARPGRELWAALLETDR